MELLKEIRAERERQEISREELALMIGRSTVTVTRYELGTEDPPLPVLYKILSALGLQIRLEQMVENNHNHITDL